MMSIQFLSVLFACFRLTHQAIRVCGEGWETAPNDGAGSVYYSCFYFYSFAVSPKLTYGQARAYCQDHGSNLATFNSSTELTDFITWVQDATIGPKASQKGGTFMLGYAYLKSEKVLTYEGISADAETLFAPEPATETKRDAEPPPEPSTKGAVGNVVVVKSEPLPFDGGKALAWGTDEVDFKSLSEDEAGNAGFVCKKPIGEAICAKLNKPYLSSFGGRRIPIRPYSRYWLMKQNNVGDIVVWTDTTKDMKVDDLVAPLLSSPELKANLPYYGPQINFVEFSTFFKNATGAIVPSEKKRYSIHRIYNAGSGMYTWWYRVLPPFNAGATQKPLTPTLGTPTVIASSTYKIDGVTSNETLTAEWFKGGQFEGGWVVTTPTYKFFFDGVDIQVFSKKSNFDNKERGLCDTISKGQSNPFFNADMNTQKKTTNLYSFINGQLRSPQFSPIAAGRPLTCTSHALFESAIKECSVLIHPASKLIGFAGFPCFLNATELNPFTDTAFSDKNNNIYQACIESVCAHGPSGKCYYVDKLLSRMKRICVPALSETILSGCRAAVGCSTAANSSCAGQNGGLTTFYNGSCYLKNKWGPESTLRMNMVDAQVQCNRLGSQLPAPQSLAYEDYVTNTAMSPEYIFSEGAWTGIMTSLKTDLPHAIPFKKVVATDEAAPIYIRSSRLADEGEDQCVKMSKNKLEYANCIEDTEANMLCVNLVSDTTCPVDCMFPKKCDPVTKTCVDPCPMSYESGGKCPIAFS